jgi:hypothetical protein
MPDKTKSVKRAPNDSLLKPVTPNEILAKVVGDKPIARTDLMKALWDYIRKHGLQDAHQRRREFEGRVQRQGAGQHVRDDEARFRASEEVTRTWDLVAGRSSSDWELRRRGEIWSRGVENKDSQTGVTSGVFVASGVPIAPAERKRLEASRGW